MEFGWLEKVTGGKRVLGIGDSGRNAPGPDQFSKKRKKSRESKGNGGAETLRCAFARFARTQKDGKSHRGARGGVRFG